MMLTLFIFQKGKEIAEVNDSWMIVSLLPFEQENIEINIRNIGKADSIINQL